MPRVLLILFSLIFSLSFGQNPEGNKKALKAKTPPPGTIQLNDKLFIDVNPVTNIAYREFTSFLSITYSKAVRDSLEKIPLYGIDYEKFKIFMRKSGNDKDLYEKMKIRLNQKLSWAMSMEEYINSPTYNDNPIIYISYSQAYEFCKWRTLVVMLHYSLESKNEKQREKYYTKIQYRLLSPEEWDEAIEKFGKNIITDKQIFPYNKACTYPVVPQAKKPVFVYVPGNIAEMTNSENVAVGISWNDKDTTANYNKRVQYLGARDWLGFRCICEILEY